MMGKLFILITFIIIILMFVLNVGIELVGKLLPNLDEMHKMWVVMGSGSLLFFFVVWGAMHLSFKAGEN